MMSDLKELEWRYIMLGLLLPSNPALEINEDNIDDVRLVVRECVKVQKQIDRLKKKSAC